MKNSLFSKKAAWASVLSCLGLVVLLSSCLKDPKPQPVGDAYVKYVNTVPESTPQEFYSNGVKINTSPLPYGSSSPYITVTSGASQFAVGDVGSTTANAVTTPVNLSIGIYATVFYYKTLDEKINASIIDDDMEAPATGKAKVRFVHLNHLLNNSIKISSGEATLVEALAFGSTSSYINVDPGTKFTLSATDVTNAPVIDAGIVAGKNYTIWIDGTVATELIGHVILQNQL